MIQRRIANKDLKEDLKVFSVFLFMEYFNQTDHYSVVVAAMLFFLFLYSIYIDIHMHV